VTRLVAARILDHAGDPSFELPSEPELGLEFGVSRTVAREVVGRLERMQLVTVRHGRRTTPRPPHEWDYLDPLLFELQDPKGTRRLLTELTEVRLAVEPEVAAWAARATKPEVVARLSATIEGTRENLADYERYVAYDMAFHTILVDATDNRVLARIMDSLQALLLTSRDVLSLLPDSGQHAIADHERIMAAVAAGDVQGARSSMWAHLDWAMRSYGIGDISGQGR
jgi:DNA-binding FadR family transcriptional regulator